MWKPSPTRRFVRLSIAATIAMVGMVSACTNNESVPLTAKAISSGLAPKDNGFSFANFGAAASPEVFNASDLSLMFGSKACSSGSGDSCQPTAQAAAWAQMVNSARQSGHCEGLVVQASQRFSEKANPTTAQLKNGGDVTHGIMRAFATQFLPEVQEATTQWAKKSLNEILNELSASFERGGLEYSLGLYTSTGGHAVLPYALEFPSKDLAVIKVYDSNWPGMERYVVINLKAQQWFFSFSGTNPQEDECAWTGKAGDIDLTPTSARTAGTCPFCGDGTKVTKSVLVIRSASTDWSVKTESGTFSPSSDAKNPDVFSRTIRSATCDNKVRLPEFVLSTDSTDFELNLPDTASAYVSNGNSVVHIVTKGKRQRPSISFTPNSIAVSDPTAQVQVAVDNVVASVETASSTIQIEENRLSINVEGLKSPVVVDNSNPQVVVTEKEPGAPKVEQSTTLVSVVPVSIPELTPDPVKPGLISVQERNLTNEVYVKAVEEVPTTPITAAPTTTEALPAGAPVTAPTESTVDSLKQSSLTTTSSVPMGGTVTVSVGGFEPREWVQLIVASRPQVLDAERADANGRVTLRGVIPELTSGSHTLAAYAPVSRRGFRQTLNVTAPPTTSGTIQQTTQATTQVTTQSTTAVPSSTQTSTGSSSPSSSAVTSSTQASTSTSSTTSTIPTATISLQMQSGEGSYTYGWADSWGSVVYYDTNNDQIYSSAECGPDYLPLCNGRSFVVPVGWTFQFTWRLSVNKYRYEMSCPSSPGTWYLPSYSYGANYAEKDYATCSFVVTGNGTIRTRAR
jgi:hypothetical protein